MNLRPIVIATALPIERDAILSYLPSESSEHNDAYTVHRGLLEGCALYTICFQGMGNVRSAHGMARALQKLRPIAVLLVGIAGGTRKPTSELFNKESHLLGDVLVAEHLIDYESGKLTPDGLKHRPDVFRASSRLLRIAKRQKDGAWKATITVDRPDGTGGRVVPNAHFGVVASGQKVLTSTASLEPISALFTNLVGVEMEGVGAAFAAHETEEGPVDFLLVKAVCDWADPAKNDGWQNYAAHSAAVFALAIIDTFISELKHAIHTMPGTPERNTQLALTAPLTLKSELVRRLGSSWEDLSDAVNMPVHEKRRLTRGNEPREIYEYLEQRNMLSLLPNALMLIGRNDLLEGPNQNPV